MEKSELLEELLKAKVISNTETFKSCSVKQLKELLENAKPKLGPEENHSEKEDTPSFVIENRKLKQDLKAFKTELKARITELARVLD